MQQPAARLLGAPLPFGTAVLSQVALTLLMWNIALRLAVLLHDGLMILTR
jgi:hypothetical protein